jgi:hypothetical protein
LGEKHLLSPEGQAMPRKKKVGLPILVVPKNATLKQIYARARAEFTAADLQKFTEIGPTVPAEQLLAELEAIHEEETRKRQKKLEAMNQPKKRKRKS